MKNYMTEIKGKTLKTGTSRNIRKLTTRKAGEYS